MALYTLIMSKKKKADAGGAPKDDPAMVSVRSLFKDSGISLVELGKRMGYAEEIARQAAWQFMKSRDPRLSMVRRFAEAMGITIEQLGIKGKRMSRKLETELAEYGCELDRVEFRELLEEHKALTSPNWTVDELVCHPDEAKSYCNHIRTMPDCENLPDPLILRTLLNARKAR
jgi:transcriptional regulator with XRE-family HTH domain